MIDFSMRKGVGLGPLCKYGHDHKDGKSFRHVKNWTCAECQYERILAWHKTAAGRASARGVKARRKLAKVKEDKEYRQRNASRLLAYNRRYRAENPEWVLRFYRAYNAVKRRKIRQATPAWADSARIIEIYEAAHRISVDAGMQHHVDHVIPLISNRVCGLHVEANLQIVSAVENLRKGNRWWPDDIAAAA